MKPDSSPPVADVAGRIPEQLPPRLPPPEPIWRAHWTATPFLLPLVLLRPRQLSGPIGVSSLWTAFVAHLLGGFALLLVSALMVGVGDHMFGMGSEDPTRTETYGQVLVSGLAELWVGAMRQFKGWREVLELLGVLLMFELGFWSAAVVLMPWLIQGERRWRALLRSLKVVWWATIGLIYLPLLVLIMLSLTFMFVPRELYGWQVQVVDDLIIACMSVGAILVLWILGGLSDRYAGPPIGKLYESHALRCRACGYELTFMERTANCPECNLAVAESLPGARSQPAVATAASLGQRLRAYPGIWWQSLRSKRFGTQLQVYNAQRGARHFTAITAAVVGVFGMLTLLFTGEILAEYEDQRYDLSIVAVVFFRLVLVFSLTASGFVGLVLVAGLLASLFGWSEPERKTTVVAYSSGWLILCAVGVCLGMGWFQAVAEGWNYKGGFRFPIGQQFIEYRLLLALVGFVPAAGLAIIWLSHLYRMLRATRYASA